MKPIDAARSQRGAAPTPNHPCAGGPHDQRRGVLRGSMIARECWRLLYAAVCRAALRDRLAVSSPITHDLYQLEESCLVRWKREMRTMPLNRMRWPPFHHTVAVIKPLVPHAKLLLLAIKLARFRRVASATRALRFQDISFIYSTAYGEAFTSELLSYYMSGPSEVILLTGPNVVGEQAATKSMIRQEVGVVDERRNLIHFPDSLG